MYCTYRLKVVGFLDVVAREVEKRFERKERAVNTRRRESEATEALKRDMREQGIGKRMQEEIGKNVQGTLAKRRARD